MIQRFYIFALSFQVLSVVEGSGHGALSEVEMPFN